MPASTLRGETDESLLHDARERTAAVLKALRRDAASLAGDPRWAEGQRLYAEACDAAEQLLAELNVSPGVVAAAAPSGEASAPPAETPQP